MTMMSIWRVVCKQYMHTHHMSINRWVCVSRLCIHVCVCMLYFVDFFFIIWFYSLFFELYEVMQYIFTLYSIWINGLIETLSHSDMDSVITNHPFLVVVHLHFSSLVIWSFTFVIVTEMHNNTRWCHCLTELNQARHRKYDMHIFGVSRRKTRNVPYNKRKHLIALFMRCTMAQLYSCIYYYHWMHYNVMTNR